MQIMENRYSEIPLGIGLAYNPSLRDYIGRHAAEFDFVEVIPDMFWNVIRREPKSLYVDIPSWVNVLTWLRSEKPLTAHYIGLSIGTDSELDMSYIEQMDSWQKEYEFAWCSDHLSYSQITDHCNVRRSIGISSPVPYDVDVCDRIIQKSKQVQAKLGIDFLLENSPSYVVLPDEDMTEVQFLNRLVSKSSCGILLDVHNLYVNGRNNGIDCLQFIDDLDPGIVREVHLAGGSELGGVYTDSHAGPCPEEVWHLLDFVLSRQRQIRGITFEFHDSYFGLMGSQGVTEQLRRARSAWERRR
jgi:uncharacterized protein